jgi:curved DNA-binding protein CbpA
MEKPENFYELLGLAKSATEMDIAQVYRTLVQQLQAENSPDPLDRRARRKQQLDTAYQTLLEPESRKKHDERLAWYIAWQKLDSDKARQLEQQLKEQQAADEEAAKQAAQTAAQWAKDEARQAAEEAARLQELARIQAEADERFRSLRLARIRAGTDDAAAQQPDFEDTVVNPQDATTVAPASAARVSIGSKTIISCLLLVGVVFWGLLGLQPGKQKPTPIPVPVDGPATSLVPTQPALPTASLPNPPPVAQKPARDDSAKVAEAALYQQALKRVEAEHPELNPRHPEQRQDLIAYVAAQLQVHIKAGYAKPKALEIAVRDLETREQTRMALERRKSQTEKPPVETATVLDKGGHAGFDPKCRWVTPEQWSCK